ncbi:MAG TPA: hypothetical protein VFM05_06375, partial [Candidatus Saccharimonadales bacterium]|nr:hypothetical protein [Candidatus Saccharimonadales bacterium]
PTLHPTCSVASNTLTWPVKIPRCRVTLWYFEHPSDPPKFHQTPGRVMAYLLLPGFVRLGNKTVVITVAGK